MPDIGNIAEIVVADLINVKAIGHGGQYMTDRPQKESPTITDEPGMADRFQRGLRRALNTPHQPQGKNPRTPPTPKPKKRPPSKGRVHKGKTRA